MVEPGRERAPRHQGAARRRRASSKSRYRQLQSSAARAALDGVRDQVAQEITSAYDKLQTSFAEYQAALDVNGRANRLDAAPMPTDRNRPLTDALRPKTPRANPLRRRTRASVFTSAAALAFALAPLPEGELLRLGDSILQRDNNRGDQIDEGPKDLHDRPESAWSSSGEMGIVVPRRRTGTAHGRKTSGTPRVRRWPASPEKIERNRPTRPSRDARSRLNDRHQNMVDVTKGDVSTSASPARRASSKAIGRCQPIKVAVPASQQNQGGQACPSHSRGQAAERSSTPRTSMEPVQDRWSGAPSRSNGGATAMSRRC